MRAHTVFPSETVPVKNPCAWPGVLGFELLLPPPPDPHAKRKEKSEKAKQVAAIFFPSI
jgi:hypothetical protein